MFVVQDSNVVRVGAALLLSLLLSGCMVTRGRMRSELEQVRTEMRSGDQAVSARVDQLNGRVDALDRDLQALRSEFDVTVRKLEGLLAFDVPVHFDFDRAEVRGTDGPVLERFAAVVQEYYPNALVTVEGFADPAGSPEYNLRLGKTRAEAVKAYLTANGGLQPDRVRTVSYGEAANRLVVPGAKGPGAAGLQNRRVSLVIDYSGPAEQRLTMPAEARP